MWKLVWIVSLALPAILGTSQDHRRGKGKIWAVLVAGSNKFYNYRHQSDVCHSYQILHRHGIPDSNIIVMMYDDIAHNPDNPNKGVIINKPGGPNVYTNVPKDYTGDNVTPDNFLHVLTGNKKALEGKGSGKVLKSGPNDHVFIYFVGYGEPDLLYFLNDQLYSDTLIKALKTMQKKKMYKKLLIYMDACECGSMFQNILPKNMNILAMTAANPTECSYACYWDNTLHTYLADEFGCAWMEDVDAMDQKGNFGKETVFEQYQKVVKRVVLSHPQIYGEMKLKKDHLKDYIGLGKRKLDSMDEIEITPKLFNGRKTIDDLFKSIVSHVTTLTDGDVTAVENEHQPLTQEARPCYKTVVGSLRKNCVSVKNAYVMAQLYKLANLCVKGYSTDDIQQAFTAECDEQHRSLTGIF